MNGQRWTSPWPEIIGCGHAEVTFGNGLGTGRRQCAIAKGLLVALLARQNFLSCGPSGYSAFTPAPLPPDPPITIDKACTRLLAETGWALGRLDGVASVLPNPDLFVAIYVRQEAVLSSQIEGPQSTLEEVLQFEIDSKGREHPKDVQEVLNYVRAMNYRLDRRKTLPLSLRLSREIHGKLLEVFVAQTARPTSFAPARTGLGRPDAYSRTPLSCLHQSMKCIKP